MKHLKLLYFYLYNILIIIIYYIMNEYKMVAFTWLNIKIKNIHVFDEKSCKITMNLCLVF